MQKVLMLKNSFANPDGYRDRRIKRRGWDSNPRYLAVNTLSKRARSATLTPLLIFYCRSKEPPVLRPR